MRRGGEGEGDGGEWSADDGGGALVDASLFPHCVSFSSLLCRGVYGEEERGKM